MKANIRRILFPILVVAIFFLLQSFDKTAPSSLEPASINETLTIATSTAIIPAPVTSTNALVLRVVDGDTIVVMRDGQTTEEKVRLLGVNTPESVDPRRAVECFGKEASRFLQSLIEGKRVRLEPDLEADEIDKYGRLLRKVIGENGVDINAHLIEQGYAYAYVTFPMNKMRRTYLKNLQSKAEQTAVGLWNPSTCDGQK